MAGAVTRSPPPIVAGEDLVRWIFLRLLQTLVHVSLFGRSHWLAVVTTLQPLKHSEDKGGHDRAVSQQLVEEPPVAGLLEQRVQQTTFRLRSARLNPTLRLSFCTTLRSADVRPTG